MTDTLAYKIISVRDPPGDVAYSLLVVHRDTGSPDVVGSLYAAHLGMSGRARNTALHELNQVMKILTWSRQHEPEILVRVAAGQVPSLPETRNLCAWMRFRSGIALGRATPSQAKTYNASLTSIRRFLEWLIVESSHGNAPVMSAALSASALTWSQIQPMSAGALNVAPDLTDSEIKKIEDFLYYRMHNFSASSKNVPCRDYLMWRMCIEYGIRLGELLCITLQHLPTKELPVLTIERLNHRTNFHDPRTSPPSVKTLGRTLGQFFKRSAFPELFSLYLNEHRWIWAKRKGGQRYQKTALPHELLIISTTTGMPLSIQGAESRALFISESTGVKFNWHMCRHAFFNRADADLSIIENDHDRRTRKAGIIYIGGWSAEASYGIYTRASQRKKSRHASLSLIKSGAREMDGE